MLTDIKVCSLNIADGRYLKQMRNFFANKEYDLICLQEVSYGPPAPNNQNNIPYLDQFLQPLHREIIPTFTHAANNEWWRACITYFNTDKFMLLKSYNVRMNPVYPVDLNSDPVVKLPWAANFTHLQIKLNQQEILVVNGHFTRDISSGDTPRKIRRATLVLDAILQLGLPTIICADMNTKPQSKTVGQFTKHFNNLTGKYELKNTLNPRLHYAKEIFPPGVACDYIFHSHNLREHSFTLYDREDLSDHFALEANLKLI